MSIEPPVPRADILMLIPNLGVGGAQRVFQEHSRLLAERYRVVDVAFNLDGGQPFPTGNPLLTLDVGGGGGMVTKACNLFRRVAALRRIKRESGARLCISHMPGADYVNLLSRGDEKTIAVVHGSKHGDRAMAGWSGRLQNRLLQPLLYKRADQLVTVSRDIGRELTSFGVAASRVRTINNFFDHEAIRAKAAEPLTPEEQALFDGTPVLITSGRLHPQKNQVALLEVFSRLKRERPVRLVILGDGELRTALLQRAEELGLAAWAAWRNGALRPGLDVYLLGALTNPFNLLAKGDVFVFPSSWEGFPLALCEAMICGLPAVSTDCPTGPREILAPDTPWRAEPLENPEEAPFGLLMPMLDEGPRQADAIRAWVGALSALLDDPATRRRLASAGRARMHDFTRERIGGQWFALVEEVLGPGAARRA
jgi:glycosyltransferase involved in cell wall biosynthesis